MEQVKFYVTLEVSEDYSTDCIHNYIEDAVRQLAEDLEAYLVDLEIK